MVDKIRASHILVKTEAEALKLLDEIKQGKSFVKLAEEHSLCSSKRRGGDLGEFGRGMMAREFEKAAFALQVGETTKTPVKTQFGYHLIRRTK